MLRLSVLGSVMLLLKCLACFYMFSIVDFYERGRGKMERGRGRGQLFRGRGQGQVFWPRGRGLNEDLTSVEKRSDSDSGGSDDDSSATSRRCGYGFVRYGRRCKGERRRYWGSYCYRMTRDTRWNISLRNIQKFRGNFEIFRDPFFEIFHEIFNFHYKVS